MIKNLIAALALTIFTITAVPASAQEATAGSTWWAVAYCTTEASAKVLSRRMIEAGPPGYNEVMRTNGVSCWDSRLSVNVPVPHVMVLEKVWRVVTFTGQVFDFWTATDTEGLMGWVWFEVEASPGNEI